MYRDMPSNGMYPEIEEIAMAKKGTQTREAIKQELSARMGRKPLSDDLRRTRRISVVVNDAEFNAITETAAAAGDPASIWGRKIMMKAVADAVGHKK